MSNYRWLVFALLGALFAGLVNVLSKRALDTADFVIALIVQATLMLLTLATAATLTHRWPKLAATPKMAIAFMAAAGVAAGLAWYFGYHALQLSNVGKSSPIDKLSMPIAVVLALIFLGERPTLLNWLGVALMLGGAICVAYTPGKS